MVPAASKVPAFVVCLFLLILALPSGTPARGEGYTHTVLAEQATATWCPYCPAVARYLREIYDTGQYQFKYVALVSDKNWAAESRRVELGVTGYPTVIFDWTCTRIVGDVGWSQPYIDALNSCGNKVVANIDLNLQVLWQGNAKVKVLLTIKNNEGSVYDGHVHVYVTEIQSRWYDYYGTPYRFAMLGDYAFNGNPNPPLQPGEERNIEAVWDGQAQGYGDLRKDNVYVVATVFGQYYQVSETAGATASDFKKGDLNCDGAINNFDIDPFVLALTDENGYKQKFPNCDRMLADCNGDGQVNNFDIDPFVKLLTGP